MFCVGLYIRKINILFILLSVSRGRIYISEFQKKTEECVIMMLEELKTRLKKEVALSIEEYGILEKCYTVLDMDKDVFACFVDAVGVDRIVAKGKYWDFVLLAIEQEEKRERYYKSLNRLAELDIERAELVEYIENVRISRYFKEERG